jgi:hypothetical protein
MRVLLHLHRQADGNAAFLYLAERLRAEFDWYISTVDPDLHQQLSEQGWDGQLFPGPSKRPPPWLKTLDKYPILSWGPQAWRQYHDECSWRALAGTILQQTRPEVVIILGDYKGIGYHLAKQAPRSMVVQVTFNAFQLEDRLADLRPKNAKGRHLTRLLDPLRHLGLPFTYELGGEVFLAHGSELGYTLGLLAAGSRPVPPLKGILADKICLNGEANRDFFLQAGYPPDKLVVTGSPKDDLFFEFKQNFQSHEAAAIRQQFNIPPHAALITLFSGATYPQEETVQKERISQVVAALLGLREDVHLIFKTHPRELPINYPALIGGHPRVRLAYYKDHPGEEFNNRLICASQLCVMGGSSVAFNVVALEVPLITFDFRDSIAEAAFGQMGVGYYAPDLAALAERAGRLLANESERAALIAQQTAAARPLMILDGQNCARIGQAIRA